MYVEAAVDVSVLGQWVRWIREAGAGEAALHDRRRRGQTCTVVMPFNNRWHDDLRQLW